MPRLCSWIAEFAELIMRRHGSTWALYIDAISCWMSANRLRLSTELIWTGAKSKFDCLPGCGLPVTLRCDSINVSSVTRVLGVLITPGLSLDQDIDAVCAKCFFQPRELRRVRRTLHDDSIAILSSPVVLVRQQLYSTSFFCQLWFLIFSGVSTSQRTQFNLLWISERHFWYSIDRSEISLQSTINWKNGTVWTRSYVYRTVKITISKRV